MLVFVTEVAVVVIGYIYRAKVRDKHTYRWYVFAFHLALFDNEPALC